MRYNIDKELLDGTSVVNFRLFDGKSLPYVSFDPTSAPVEIDGLPFNSQNRTLCRLPESGLRDAAINGGVSRCGAHRPAGVTFRFRTNSTLIGVRAVIGHNTECAVMPAAAKCGFTFYEGIGTEKKKIFTAEPKDEQTLLVEDYRGTPGIGAWREWTVYCPLLTEVPYVRLLLTHNADIESPTPYRHPAPIVFYGSSITNGVGASDSSMDYPSRISRLLDQAVINLGFNGSCKGETAMARHIASLRGISAFVMGFDHNAKTPEELAAHHEPFFRIVRAAHPEWPILLCTRPNSPDAEDARRSAAIVRTTYEHALAAGDRRVWFLDGLDTFPGNDTPRYTCSDGIHPSDDGYTCIVNRLLPVLAEMGVEGAVAFQRKAPP